MSNKNRNYMKRKQKQIAKKKQNRELKAMKFINKTPESGSADRIVKHKIFAAQYIASLYEQAREQYEKHGRGTLVINEKELSGYDPLKPEPLAVTLSYITASHVSQLPPDPITIKLKERIDSYETDKMFLLFIFSPEGGYAYTLIPSNYPANSSQQGFGLN